MCCALKSEPDAMASEENCSSRDSYPSVSRTVYTGTGLPYVVLSDLGGVLHFAAKIIKQVQQVFSGGDPIVKEWFLVRETYLPFLLCGCYILFCTRIGPALMRNRKPFDLRVPMIVFNFAIVATYVIGIITALIYLPQASWEEFCIRGVIKKGHFSYTLGCTAWVIYVLKYVEYMDTVFFVLRKKTRQMSFLHLVHHTTVPLMGWILLRTGSNGIQSIPVLINSFVHVIMYTYYGLAAMGPQTQKYLWWKKYLTQLQMAQFLLIFLFTTVVVPLLGCTMLMVECILIIGSVSFFLFLFYRFYQVTFRQKID